MTKALRDLPSRLHEGGYGAAAPGAGRAATAAGRAATAAGPAAAVRVPPLVEAAPGDHWRAAGELLQKKARQVRLRGGRAPTSAPSSPLGPEPRPQRPNDPNPSPNVCPRGSLGVSRHPQFLVGSRR